MYLSEQVDSEYDVIVAGAGPAGSMSAWEAARNGLSVLLLEKDREVGTPVRCAEGAARRELENLINTEISARSIATRIVNFRIIAPNGNTVSVNIDDIGYVLHRKFFDYELALKAVEAGAVLMTQAPVVNVVKTQTRVSGVHASIDGEIKTIKSKIVIAADGVESRVARWAGIDSTVRLKDMETCIQYTLADIDIHSDTCNFYFSNDFAPGGYAWVFPKEKRLANVGLGIAGDFARKKSPEDYLQIFLQRYFPKASVISKTTGGVPADETLKHVVADGFMVVGDAAHQANPVSGGGIISGMTAGKIAGETAVKAIKKGSVSKKNLLPYAREWHKRVGKQHQRYYRLKEALRKFEDEQFNYIAKEYLNLGESNRNLFNLFKIAFKSNPSILFDVFKLFPSI